MLNVVDPIYFDEGKLGSLREEFLRSGYVKLPGVLSSVALSAIVTRLAHLRRKATRRSFVMPGVETPRRMSTLGGKRISEEEPVLAWLYWHEEVLSLLRSITGRSVHRCQHEEEFMVANFLTSRGDSHGWHLDDPAFALILVLDAPPAEAGGCLEFIPNWRKRCVEWGEDADRSVLSGVARARAQGCIETRHHVPGDGYVLMASTALHRVAPILSDDGTRSALNMAYQDRADQTYGHTATRLYGDAELAEAVLHERSPASEQLS